MAGTLLAFFEWHILFIINIPIVLILIFFSRRLLDPNPVESSSELDWKGILLMGLFLGSFTFGINNLDLSEGWHTISSLRVWPYVG